MLRRVGDWGESDRLQRVDGRSDVEVWANPCIKSGDEDDGAEFLALSLFLRPAIDIRHWTEYIVAHLVHRGAFREGTFESGTRAVPARGVTTRTRAALGIIHAGITTGAGGAFPGLGQARAGNARRIRVPGSMAWS